MRDACFNLTCQDLTCRFPFQDPGDQEEATEGTFRANVGDSSSCVKTKKKGGGVVAGITEMILPFIPALKRTPSSLPKPC